MSQSNRTILDFLNETEVFTNNPNLAEKAIQIFDYIQFLLDDERNLTGHSIDLKSIDKIPKF